MFFSSTVLGKWILKYYSDDGAQINHSGCIGTVSCALCFVQQRKGFFGIPLEECLIVKKLFWSV